MSAASTMSCCCSTDGFELAHVYKRDGCYNSTKLVAVSSSILAMVAAFMNEIHLEGCQSITLDADNFKAFDLTFFTSIMA